MRPAKFNRDMAMTAATELFWSQGYEGTSVQQLLDVMGINRSTLYASFGDKRELFTQSLSLFGVMAALACAPLRQDKPPHLAVKEFLELVFFGIPAEKRKKGCLLVNTILEQSGLDDSLAAEASRQLAKVGDELRWCFERAQSRHELSAQVSAEALAAYFMVVIKGLRVAVREGCSDASLRSTIDISIKVLGSNE
ncbi:MAG: TetR/AcrR family transcriptional regulator [Hahellaceae bacterium]|jgi:TetR/AcrR family transcriptional repressor of nem operon|nr:TetR/AcrR family transcriptional regulator [Hahellaceae bacterium]